MFEIFPCLNCRIPSRLPVIMLCGGTARPSRPPFSPDPSRTRLTPRLGLLVCAPPPATVHSSACPFQFQGRAQPLLFPAINSEFNSFVVFRVCVHPTYHPRPILVAPHDTSLPLYCHLPSEWRPPRFALICAQRPTAYCLLQRPLASQQASQSAYHSGPETLRWKSRGLGFIHTSADEGMHGMSSVDCSSSRFARLFRCAPSLRCRYVDVRSTVDLPRRALVGGIGPRSRSAIRQYSTYDRE